MIVRQAADPGGEARRDQEQHRLARENGAIGGDLGTDEGPQRVGKDGAEEAARAHRDALRGAPQAHPHPFPPGPPGGGEPHHGADGGHREHPVGDP